MMNSILSRLPLASVADGVAPTAHASVVLGTPSESGWPLQRSNDAHSVIMVVHDEAAARSLCHLLNTVANFLTHGMVSDDRLAFVIGIDAAWDVEAALHTLGISLHDPATP